MTGIPVLVVPALLFLYADNPEWRKKNGFWQDPPNQEGEEK